VSRYSRQDVLRILQLHPRQLKGWERAGLISPSQHYGFDDLSQLRILRSLHTKRISAKKIYASVMAMQRLVGIRNPLVEAGAVRRGSGVAFRYRGSLLDPVTQQLAFDFGASSPEELRVAGGAARDSSDRGVNRDVELQEMFLRAVQLEEAASTLEEAAELYRKILDIRASHAAAAINLGTIHYNRREFRRAEELYRRATEADPDYALAFFDLGNVLDETMQLDAAIAAYQQAVTLVPHYADAHYNLALAYERQGERRRALRHWLAYARLDPVGPWGSHAKGQARKILSTERLSIVSRRGRKVPIAG
jgi:tetratricopeptide (TPR) repeat protein